MVTSSFDHIDVFTCMNHNPQLANIAILIYIYHTSPTKKNDASLTKPHCGVRLGDVAVGLAYSILQLFTTHPKGSWAHHNTHHPILLPILTRFNNSQCIIKLPKTSYRLMKNKQVDYSGNK